MKVGAHVIIRRTEPRTEEWDVGTIVAVDEYRCRRRVYWAVGGCTEDEYLEDLEYAPEGALGRLPEERFRQ